MEGLEEEVQRKEQEREEQSSEEEQKAGQKEGLQSVQRAEEQREEHQSVQLGEGPGEGRQSAQLEEEDLRAHEPAARERMKAEEAKQKAGCQMVDLAGDQREDHGQEVAAEHQGEALEAEDVHLGEEGVDSFPIELKKIQRLTDKSSGAPVTLIA